jgi:hypothetical protein
VDTIKVGAIIITGNLDLRCQYYKKSDSTAGATSINVSGTSDLGADVTNNQEHKPIQEQLHYRADNTLTTTSNGSVSFGSTTNGAQTLSITTNGTGDVTFTDDVGGSAGLNGLTISTNDFNAVDLKVGGTISITNTGTSSEITGVIANDDTAAVFTKAGSGTLTLSGTNTYTGVTTISNGILILENDILSLPSSSYTGSGTLIIQSSSGSFSSGITLTSSKINSSIGNLTLGKSGNTASITISGDLEVVGNLTIYGPSILNGDITTGGNQSYTGNTTIYATDVNISSVGSSSAGGDITFTGNIDGQTEDSNSLFILSGAGDVSVTGNIGDTTSLNKLGFGGFGSSIIAISETFSYTGGVQSYTATRDGTFTLSVWGAQGGSGYTTTGGKGGYATGEITLTAGQTIYIEIGGQGSKASGVASGGGYNGGGNGGIDTGPSQNGGGGGGATDIRVGGTALSDRVIVAGGGAGGGRDGTTGVGGGNSGTSSTDFSSGKGGSGGSQVSGGTAYITSRGATNGSLGLGGAGSTGFYSAGGGGGGGGYYGGGGGTSTQNHGSGYSAGGGGGSAYIGGVTDGSTIAGNASMPNPSGGTMTGRIGNGYATITADAAESFTGGTQTGSFTISGNIDVATLETASQSFDITIGQSGASTIGSNTTFNNTGNLTVGSNAVGQSFAVSGALIASAQSTINIGGSISSTSSMSLNSPVILKDNTSLTTTNSQITIGDTVNSESSEINDLTVSTGSSEIQFDGVVGGVSTLGAISITGKLDLNAAIGNGATAGATSINVSGTTNLGANVTTSATQTYQDTLTLDSGTSLTLDAGISEDSDINLAAVTGVSGGAAENLTLDAGSNADAAIAVTGTVTDITTLTIRDAGSVTFGDAVTLATKIDLQATTGTITFNGALTTSDIDTDTADGYNIILNAGGTITNATTFANTGTLTIGDASGDTMTFNNGITATDPSGVTLAGTIQTSGDAISIGDSNTPITLAANTIVDGNTAGDITLGGAINGGYSLTLNTTGTTTLSGAIGGSTALTTLTTNASGTTVISVDIETSSTQTYNDAVTINGTLDFTGSTVQFASTLAGNDGSGDNLTISGNLDLDGAATSLTSLTVEGTSNLGADVTTSGTQTYTGAVTLSGAARTLTTAGSAVTFSNTVDGAQDLTVDTTNSGGSSAATVQFGGVVGGTTPVGAIIITGNLDLNANILQSDNTAGATSVAVSGTSDLGASVKTTGDQTYTGNTTVSADITLTGGAQLTFGGTVNSSSTDSASDTDNLSIVFTETEFDGIVGGTYGLGVISITGALDLDNDITSATSLSVSTTSNLGADVTTSGTQTYTGAVTLSADVTLTTTDNNITFNGTVNSADAINRALTINLDNNNNGTTADVIFGNATADTIGVTYDLGAIQITGDLDLNAAIGNGGTAGATSISVSGTSNLGANVTTSGTQTYTGAVTLSANTTITTTDNDVSFGATIARDGTARNLTLNTGTGTVSVTGNVGSGAALGIITLTQTGGTTFSGTLDAATVTLTDTADATDITFSGSATIATLNTAAQPYNIVFNGAANTITNLVTFTNTGTVTLGNGASDSSTFNNGITATDPSGVTLAGTIQTSGDAISIGDSNTPITLAANTIVDGNTAGDITLGGAINGGYSLTLNTTGTTTYQVQLVAVQR